MQEAIKASPRHLKCEYVFVNPNTGTRWMDIRKMFARALGAAGLTGVWLHDQRRSFITLARRGGVAESVVMKFSGHKTRAVFDRYNVVDEEDVRRAVAQAEAATSPEKSGQDLDRVDGKQSQND